MMLELQSQLRQHVERFSRPGEGKYTHGLFESERGEQWTGTAPKWNKKPQSTGDETALLQAGGEAGSPPPRQARGSGPFFPGEFQNSQSLSLFLSLVFYFVLG